MNFFSDVAIVEDVRCIVKESKYMALVVFASLEDSYRAMIEKYGFLLMGKRI
jgi:hypothetical protein